MNFDNILWGAPLAAFIYGVGTLLTIYLFFPQVRFFWHSLRVLVGKYTKLEDFADEPSIFKAFCTAISAPIGLGSIAGVAIAISVGGPGAVFWMMVAGFLGMAIKLTSISVNLLSRIKDPKTGNCIAGPMFTLREKLPKRFRFIAHAFAILTILAAFAGGNLFQTNQMAAVITHSFNIPGWSVSLIVAIMVGMTLLGSKKFETIVNNFAPIMVVVYTIGAIGILLINYHQIPSIIKVIWNGAFYFKAAGGTALGLGFREIIITGARRALFSNEAGIGATVMAPRPREINPIQQGVAGMLGPFIDTVIVCGLTAFIILSSGAWDGQIGIQGIELTAKAFIIQYGEYGRYGIIIFVLLFAFSTMMTWANCGELAIRSIIGLHNHQIVIKTYRTFYTLVSITGPFVTLGLLLTVTDTIFGLMLIPNLLVTLYMSRDIRKRLRKFRKDIKAERI